MKYLPALILIVAAAFSTSAQTKTTASHYDFATTAMDGTKVETARLRGKVLVYNLWFINCPNCLEEMKLLNQLVTDYADNKDVVFIAPAASRRADLEKFLQKNPFRYTVIPDAAQIILSRFGTPNKSGQIDMPFPMHVVVDRSGNAVVQVQGTKGVEAVRKELEKQFPPKPAK